MSPKPALRRLATQLGLPLDHDPAKEDEHGLCGCVECYLAWTAKAPPPSKLEQRVQPALITELFQGNHSLALSLLLQLVAEEKVTNRENAKPGEARKALRATREALEARRQAWIAVEGHEWGWIKDAASFFNIDPKTVYSRWKRMPKE